MRLLSSLLLSVLLLSTSVLAGDFPTFVGQEIDKRVGDVCYAVATADVNGDGRPDVVAVAGDAIVWYQNPTWAKHDILRGGTERDNVCLQPHDIDGDGRVDFAVGAGWAPANTKTGGTIQWVTRSGAKDGGWRVIPIGQEPTVHRVRWGDLLGKGKGSQQLVVAPLQGRGTKGPDWGAGQGVRILVYTVPGDPAKDAWPVEVVDSSLHTTHNLQVVDFDDDGRNDIVVSAWEGVFVLKNGGPGRWLKTRIGTGNQEATPFKGASEIKVGRLRDGSKYVATVEPWHGFQVVVYNPLRITSGRQSISTWTRRVIDEPVQWGHAVWCADLDGDGDDELIVGQRDPSKVSAEGRPKGPGILVYDPKPGSSPLAFDRHVVDDGGVAVEDAVAADLDGDGRPEIVAGGRATHNVKIYWNRPGR